MTHSILHPPESRFGLKRQFLGVFGMRLVVRDEAVEGFPGDGALFQTQRPRQDAAHLPERAIDLRLLVLGAGGTDRGHAHQPLLRSRRTR